MKRSNHEGSGEEEATHRLPHLVARRPEALAEAPDPTAKSTNSGGALIDTTSLHAIDVARVLHDECAQELAAVEIQLCLLANELARYPAAEVACGPRLEESRRLMQIANTRIRRLSQQLVPPLLAELGPPAALHEQARRIASPMAILADAGLPRLKGEAEGVLYRLGLEWMNSGRVETMRFSERERRLLVEAVAGAEREPDAAAWVQACTSRWHGLTRWLQAQGGDLQILSDNEAVKVRLLLPLEQAAGAGDSALARGIE